jgi:3D (Asp-Asp-Asp) domain-containing protein
VLPELLFTVTAYATGCDTRPGSRTKAGRLPVVGFTIAANPAVLPIGSIIHVEGLGERQVHDVGGAVRGRHVDVFAGTCTEARLFGKQRRRVRVLHVPRPAVGRF